MVATVAVVVATVALVVPAQLHQRNTAHVESRQQDGIQTLPVGHSVSQA